MNLTLDDDGFIRSQQLAARHPVRGVEPQFALAVFAQAEGLTEEWFHQPRLELDGSPIPLDAAGRLLINHVGPAGSIDTVSFHDVLTAARGETPSPRPWDGKIVLIGVTSFSQPDRHPTSYANQSITRVLSTLIGWHKAETTPGTEIHANIVATLYDRAYITTPWWLSTGPLLVFFGALLGATFCRTTLEFGALVAVVHHFAWKVVTVVAFTYGHFRVEMVSMFLLGVIVYAVTFALRWRLIRRMMGMVKSEAVARVLESNGGSLRLRGEEREITILFSDIRNFTSYSERHSASHVVRLLNTYFAVVVPAIEEAGGIVNQYIGDGLMVIFGAPERQPDHALRAVKAALAIINKVHQYRQRWDDLGADEFEVGVGVCTGKAVVGTIGSPRRLDYTAIGDTVNTAARIESGNKELETEILIAESTFLALPAAARERYFPQVERRQLSVKGKREPIYVYPITTSAPARAVVSTVGAATGSVP